MTFFYIYQQFKFPFYSKIFPDSTNFDEVLKNFIFKKNNFPSIIINQVFVVHLSNFFKTTNQHLGQIHEN